MLLSLHNQPETNRIWAKLRYFYFPTDRKSNWRSKIYYSCSIRPYHCQEHTLPRNKRGNTPQESKEGLILPLWKRKGSRSDCSNYRGITLQSVLSKLFAMTLLNRSTQFLRKYHRIPQTGFMP